MRIFLAPLLLVLFAGAEDKPKPKFPLGRDTSYVDGPVDPEGLIDYEDEKTVERIEAELSSAIQSPWSSKAFPQIAAWVKANEKTLKIIREASKRTEYYNPVVCTRTTKGRAPFFVAHCLGAHESRGVANFLIARAMMEVEEGQFDEAWQDLLTCHRLGRLVARGGTNIEFLCGIAIDRNTCKADLAYVEKTNLNLEQLQERIKQLRELPAFPLLADQIDQYERLIYLDSFQHFRCAHRKRGISSTASARMARMTAGVPGTTNRLATTFECGCWRRTRSSQRRNDL